MTAYMLLCSLNHTFPKENVENLLNKNLISLFPNSSLLKNINKEWLNEINLLDLLTHRSGLTDYIDAYSNGLLPSEELNKPINVITLLQSISFNPKKEHLYSNSNYLLIGKLIEELNQDSFDHLFNKMIKTPANMVSSFAPTSGNYFSFIKNESYSNLVQNFNEKVFLDMANAVGAGNIISTVSDLEKWGKYLFNKAPRNIVESLLKKYGTDPDGDTINLGLSTMDTCLGEFIGHQGSLDSYNSFFGYAPEENALIIMLSNQNDDANKLMEVMSEYLSQPKEAILNIEQEKLLWSYNQKLINEEQNKAFIQNNNLQHLETEKYENKSNHLNHPK